MTTRLLPNGLTAAEMRERAEKATPGKRTVCSDSNEYPGIDAGEVCIVIFGEPGNKNDDGGIRGRTLEEAHANAAHIASFDRETCLALVDAWERLPEVEKELKDYRDAAGVEAFHGDEARLALASARQRIADLERGLEKAYGDLLYDNGQDRKLTPKEACYCTYAGSGEGNDLIVCTPCGVAALLANKGGPET